MRPLLTLFFLTAIVLAAAPDTNPWSVRAAFGYADQNDLGEILSMQPSPHPAGTSAGGVEAGYLLSDGTWGLPISWYAKGGLNRFFENGFQDDFFELTAYLKAYWHFRPWQNDLRIGLGEGVSYAFGIPVVEQQEAAAEGDSNSRILNYIDISFDLDVGRLIRYNPLHETYVGYALKHRSGAYGLINSVSRGGSNYNMVYIEKNF